MTHWTHPAHIVSGLVIWALWFVVVYAFLSVGCAVAPPDQALGSVTWINGILLLLTVLTTLGLIAASVRCWRVRGSLTEATHQQRFVVSVALCVYALSAFATLAVGLPVLVWPPCI